MKAAHIGPKAWQCSCNQASSVAQQVGICPHGQCEEVKKSVDGPKKNCGIMQLHSGILSASYMIMWRSQPDMTVEI